jgi:hypothetical protein
MTHQTRRTIILVPGLRGHVEDHWQTRLAAKLPNTRVVESFGRDKRDLGGRVNDLQQVVEDVDGPATIVAHSAGCLVTVHWARLHAARLHGARLNGTRRQGADRDDAPVRGALLATPPDLATPLPGEYPSLDELREQGWLPIPRTPLPFASVVAASTNDTLGDHERVRALADAWGSRFVGIGPVGHLNPASGYGEWPEAEVLLDVLDDMLARRSASPTS